MRPVLLLAFATLIAAPFPTALLGSDPSSGGFRVGAAVTDITPADLPVLVNGGMLTRSADRVKTQVSARAIVLEDASERVAIVVVDSCMMPRPLLDEAKQLASQRTGIAPDRMLISATHTHTAPSCMGALGTDADPAYVSYLRDRLAEAVAAAEANLEPATVGWGVGQAPDHTALRRWVRRPDRVDIDPFGNRTVRANMHAANNWDDVIGPSGPEDPALSMISFQSPEGRPIAVLANFSMHYFGDQPLSADYFGLFSEGLKERISSATQQGDQASDNHPPFVGIMSHGCSGDIWRRDYALPEEERPAHTIEGFTEDLLEIAMEAYRQIDHQTPDRLKMAESRLRLRYRLPDQQWLEWAQRIVDEMQGAPPKNTTEVYAREQLILAERKETDVVVQAVRIGDIGIATTPTETYALTGLKVKHQSPLEKTMVIELANGGDGYIPPPEQHLLGGYNTWPARSAGLEVDAEPKITAAALGLLEQVTGKPRQEYRQSVGPVVEAILQEKPVAYYRLDEMSGPRAVDASGNHRDGILEPPTLFFLEGPQSERFCLGGEVNRAAHFAGGRLRVRLDGAENAYSVSMWFWNGMPVEGRETAGWLISRDFDDGLSRWGEHLGVGGTASEPGRLVLQIGDPTADGAVHTGKTSIDRWSWNHLTLTRSADRLLVYLNRHPEPAIDIALPADFPASMNELFIAGRSDNQSNWEGRIDEVAVFDRAIVPKGIETVAPQRPDAP